MANTYPTPTEAQKAEALRQLAANSGLTVGPTTTVIVDAGGDTTTVTPSGAISTT